MAIGIIEISVPPTPRHHAWQFGDVEVLLLELSAEVVEFSDFEVQAHAIARNGLSRTRLMQSDRSIPSRRAEARIHRLILVAKVFDELESQQIAVEDKPAFHVSNVDHGLIEGEFPFSLARDRSLVRLRLALLDVRAPRGRRTWSLLRRDSSSCWLFHEITLTKRRKYRRRYADCQAFTREAVSDVQYVQVAS